MDDNYNEKEKKAIAKAKKILEKAGIIVEDNSEYVHPDGILTWGLHSSLEE